MINNKLTLFTAAAALAQQVSGLSAHRHLHEALEKRALDAEKRVAELEARGPVVKTEWVYEYVTTTIHQGQPPAPTDQADAVVEVEAPPTTFVPVVKPEAVEAPQEDAPQEEAAPEEKPKKDNKPKKNNSNNDDNSNGSGSSGSSSNGAPSGGKRGIAYNDGNLANTFGASCDLCSWGYNWEQTRDDLDDKYNFVPTLWGNDNGRISTWATNAKNAISTGSKALFCFNEPDIHDQAFIEPATAASDFKTHMNPFSGDALIGTPGISNSGKDNEGLDWLRQWIEACNGECKFDFCNVHWYSQPQHSDTLFSYLKEAHDICGKPLWLTEFAPLTDNPEFEIMTSGPGVDSFVKEVIPKLDELDYLDAYSYFMVSENSLISGNSLSSSGQTYATS